MTEKEKNIELSGKIDCQLEDFCIWLSKKYNFNCDSTKEVEKYWNNVNKKIFHDLKYMHWKGESPPYIERYD